MNFYINIIQFCYIIIQKDMLLSAAITLQIVFEKLTLIFK